MVENGQLTKAEREQVLGQVGTEAVLLEGVRAEASNIFIPNGSWRLEHLELHKRACFLPTGFGEGRKLWLCFC